MLGVRLPASSAVIFFVDGMDRRVMEQMLQDGLLPNIHARFVEGGVGVDHAIASLPAVTYSNTVSILTGLFPGHHGIMGNKWFDRSEPVFRDYGYVSTYRTADDHFSASTLFEALGDRLSVNVLCHTHRGATVSIDNVVKNGVDWFFGAFSNVDRRVGKYADDVVAVARKRATWPTLTLYYFPGVDEIGHRRGSDSPAYRRALTVADEAIGRVGRAIDAQGLSDRTYYVLVTDHGHVPQSRDKSIDIVRWLRRQYGWRIHTSRMDPGNHSRNVKRLESCDAVVIVGADRRAVIHLPGMTGWTEPPTAKRIRAIIGTCRSADQRGGTGLLGLPGVGLICMRDGPDRVRVISAEGAAIIERRTTPAPTSYRLTYEPPDAPSGRSTPDFLGYRKTSAWNAIASGDWLGSRQWLSATCATQHPDFVPQIVEMFDSPRAGDIVLFARDGWAWGTQYKGGHGSCTAGDMRVPLYFAGPGLPPGGRVDHARIVDVMPTVLDLLGERDRLKHLQPLDGESIAAQLRSAGSDSR